MKEVIMQVASYSSDYPKAPIYVADLVRCKECKSYDTEAYQNGYGYCGNHMSVLEDNDFCSRGERRKTLDYCDICNHKGCKDCIANNLDDYCIPSHYAPKADTPQTDCEDVWRAGYKTGYDKGFRDARKVNDSQDLVKDLVKAFCEDGTWLERQGVYTLTLAEAKQRAVDIIESVLAKDEPSTQTETQNSNLTFEKDECAKEYEELGLKELKELIEADRKTENSSEKPNNSTSSKMEQVEKQKCPFDDPIPCEWVCTEYGKCKYKESER